MIEQGENWLVRALGDLERIEACFSGAAFAPHRHDTYAIGVTLRGVQSFDYRGIARHSRPGQFVVLHPDERHDGRAGGDTAFHYRTAHIAPSDIQEVLGGRQLPFIEDGVSGDARLRGPISALLRDHARPLTQLELQDALYDLAMALMAVSGKSGDVPRVNRAAAIRARGYIDAHVTQSFSLADLERTARHNRWQLSRDFRALFGTSPHRYQIQRKLERARRLMMAGRSGAEAAIASGFSDQAHFCRQFRKSFGLTPTAWLRAAHNRSIRAGVCLPN